MDFQLGGLASSPKPGRGLKTISTEANVAGLGADVKTFSGDGSAAAIFRVPNCLVHMCCLMIFVVEDL
jgi:hypothetical protein